MADLALLDQRFHGFQRLFDWDGVVRSMKVVEIEVFGLQAPQALVDGAQDRLAR